MSYEFRDPIFGFIKLDEWELDLVNHPVFQRLRRINQLGFTNMVYPGANHTRFEHSLGVMHIATRMFENIVERSRELLLKEFGFKDAGFDRDKKIVRLAALLHDVGHTPFSHAGEDVMPEREFEKKYKHEHYSAALIKILMKDVIENHNLNQNFHIKAEEIANLIEGSPACGRTLIWKDLISSQLDADRSDYLLRDSHHLGVNYGKYDLNRLLVTLKFIKLPEESAARLVFENGGIHAVEALIIARYMMFNQVYFQHTRRAYDFHYSKALARILKNTFNTPNFPPPTTSENLNEYLRWDDWRVCGLLHETAANGNDHAKIILDRKHFRLVWETSEQPTDSELLKLEEIAGILSNKDIEYFIDSATSSWYKLSQSEIAVLNEKKEVVNLSTVSPIVKGLKAKKCRIYTPSECKETVLNLINGKGL